MIKELPAKTTNENKVRFDEVGFVARALVTASMPHSKPKGIIYKRQCNNFTLSIVGNEEAGGIPYGSYPRLILSWLVTEVIRTKSREIILGRSLSDFMKSLGLQVTGGRSGTLSRFKEQLCRLFASTITCSYSDNAKGQFSFTRMSIAEKANIFWNPANPSQFDLFNSTILLGEEFYNEVIENPIPINIATIEQLKESSLALDIYFWMTYRMSYVKSRTFIPFEQLQTQFGAGYSDTRHSKYEFKRKFLIQLEKVISIYDEVNIKIEKDGISLMPSKTHIKKSPQVVLQNPNELNKDLISKLKEFGVSEGTALKIIENYASEQIEKSLAYVTKRINNSKLSKVSDIAGYVVHAITNNYQIDSKSNTKINTMQISQDFIDSVKSFDAKKVYQELLEIYGSEIFFSWFTKMEFISVDNSSVSYQCPSSFICNYLVTNYQQHILSIWKNLIPQIKICSFYC